MDPEVPPVPPPKPSLPPPGPGLRSPLPARVPPPPRPERPQTPVPVKKKRVVGHVESFLRVLLVLAICGGAVYFGWNKSFSQYYAEWTGGKVVLTIGKAKELAPVQAVPTTITIPGSLPISKQATEDWLWDPARKSRLDEKPAGSK